MAVGLDDYIRHGQASEKVGCSIWSAWVELGFAFDESGHSEVWEIKRGVSGWASYQIFSESLVFL